jgi:hypothetical protein
MSDKPALDYLPRKLPGQATRLALHWLRGVALIYAGLFAMGVLACVTDGDLKFDLASLLEIALSFLVTLGTAALLFISSIWLSRGQRRGIRLSICVVLINIAYITAQVGWLFWVTFSGKVDPGVPFLNVCAMVVFAGFAALVLGPMMYYVLKASGEGHVTMR